jgi:MOSC domain-containing protein YiiM
MAEVISIHIVRKQNAPTESCSQVMVRTNFGIEGDYRSGKYQIGQITLVEAEIMDTVSRELGYNIPVGASRRQIMVGGITLNDLIGQNLSLGPVLVRVEDKCNPCNNMEKRIGLGAKNAMNGRGGIRCRIIGGGELRVGDKITVEDSGFPYYAKLSSLCFKIISYLIKLSNKV